MADDKKYYWLKLKKDFFKRHDIQIIESMPNGKDYLLFYLKLLVESVDHDGNLRFNDTIPYNENMLSTITNTNVDVVKSAMKIFLELKMIDMLADETIYMNEIQKMLGTETYWAEQKRKQRENKPYEIGQCPQNVQLMSNVSNQEIELDKEIDKELDKKPSSQKLKFTDEHIKLANYLKELILLNNHDAIVPKNNNKWANTIRLMCEVDKRLPENIEIVIEWCQKDGFWKTNILSVDKLRKQFDQLSLKMKQEEQQQKLFGNQQPKLSKREQQFDELERIMSDYDRSNERKVSENVCNELRQLR